MGKNYFFVRESNDLLLSNLLSEAKSIFCRLNASSSVPISLFIILFFTPICYLSAQTYNAQTYGLISGGGMTETGQPGRISIFRPSTPNNQIAFHLSGLDVIPEFMVMRSVGNNSYPIFVSQYPLARIIGMGSLEFSGGGKGLNDGADAADVTIDATGNVGIGIGRPSNSKLHVGGNVRVNGNLYLGDYSLTSPSHFDIRGSGNNFWVGTTTNTPMALGTRNGTSLYIDAAGKTSIGGNIDDINVSSANRNKYSLFVMGGGALSEDYGIGPKATWADFVFDNNYDLMSLNEIEAFIKTYKHLPDIPKSSEIKENGYSIHDMNVRLLQKIEELTLHLIEQDKEIKKLELALEKYRDFSGKIIEDPINN